MKLTSIGAQNVAQFDQFMEHLRPMVEATPGGDLAHVYMTSGDYDFVAIANYDSDEGAATFALAEAQVHWVTTSTMRAFDHSDVKKMLGHIEAREALHADRVHKPPARSSR